MNVMGLILRHFEEKYIIVITNSRKTVFRIISFIYSYIYSIGTTNNHNCDDFIEYIVHI